VNPADIKEIATAAMASGGIVFFGALYAIFYALGRLRADRRFSLIGFGSYGGLVACTVLLTEALVLRGMWLLLIPALLLGYLIAPPFIWRLCHAVHRHDDPVEATSHE
jgi:hypothetical protein